MNNTSAHGPAIDIRAEQPGDLVAIREVHRLAFAGDAEPRLVDALRSAGLTVVSLVALASTRVIGHVLFSELECHATRGHPRAASLAPVGVAPEHQRRGVGGALIRRGLELCRARGVDVVVVLGHPEYYPRFGFSAAAARGLESPYSGSEAFMALPLTPAFLAGERAALRYPDAFSAV
ncbi:MAG: N-acetyltransferase [Myxococcales bacterium]|nr:N-acetyltransferase [Myxococcales bacterium]